MTTALYYFFIIFQINLNEVRSENKLIKYIDNQLIDLLFVVNKYLILTKHYPNNATILLQHKYKYVAHKVI